MTDSTKKPGTVYLIGAGPGDPGLMTLRGVECLKRGDLVLYDYLVNPATLEHVSPDAELIGLGHHSFGRAMSPDEINQAMVDGALEGKTVVRLKGGDPSVFGRGADEMDACRAAGIPYEIVPGITAGLALAAYSEIPITHHEDASAVALIAGQERHCKENPSLNYGVLAEFPGTLIFYMGVRTAPRWSESLIENGKSPDTPVAIVRRCTWPQQRIVHCKLSNVVETVEREGIRPPTLFVVGPVAGRAPDTSWFAARPMFGLRVLVAGSSGTSEKLRDRMATLGADVVIQPAIRIMPASDWAPVDAAIDQLGDYDWVVFSSSNGVDHFMQRLFDRGGDARSLAGRKLAVVGSATADRLATYHLNADLVPEKFNAEALAKALAPEADGKRFLWATANRGRQVLQEQLTKAGGQVDQIVVYENVDVDEPSPDVAEALAEGKIHWTTVTSSATARSLNKLYGDALGHTQFASMSPLTSAALREMGFDPAAEADPHTADGIVDAILEAESE